MKILAFIIWEIFWFCAMFVLSEGVNYRFGPNTRVGKITAKWVIWAFAFFIVPLFLAVVGIL